MIKKINKGEAEQDYFFHSSKTLSSQHWRMSSLLFNAVRVSINTVARKKRAVEYC